MPGPVLTVTISESARRGFWAGPLIILGHAVLEIILLVLIVMGLAEIITHPRVIGTIGVLGGIILFWFSMLMLRDVANLRIDLDQEKAARSANPVLAGILLSLANPYWTIWWATIGLGYVVISMKLGLAGLAVFFVGHILADLAWYSSVALMVSRGKRFISDRVYRGMIAVCAVLLVAFGIYFGYSGAVMLL